MRAVGEDREERESHQTDVGRRTKRSMFAVSSLVTMSATSLMLTATRRKNESRFEKELTKKPPPRETRKLPSRSPSEAALSKPGIDRR
jgi:hypothetical protein